MRSFSRRVAVPQPGPRNKFLVVKSADWTPFVVIARTMLVAETHWIGRSVPCIRHEGNCPNCKPGGRPRYTGYLHALNPLGTDDCFLVLPHGTVFRLQQAHGMDFNYRGRKLRLRRAGKGQTAALHAELDIQFQYAGQLPHEKDPNGFLEKMFARVLHLTESEEVA